MTDIDLSRLPTGSRGWRSLIEYAANSDDRIERFFLELKSDVDLNTKAGRHKVAKFILGAAHRDPVRAAKRFGGHALLVLGVSPGSVVGIRGFEAMDLERDVQKFAGADGPTWDFERIQVNSKLDVIVVVVDPPSGRVWPCLSDGDGLANGDIYIRGDGETRKAHGDEILAILARATGTSTLPEFSVELMGEVNAIRVDKGRLVEWLDLTAQDFLDDVEDAARPSAFGMMNTASLMESRSQQEFQEEVEKRRKAATDDPISGLTDVAARMSAGVQLRLVNPTKRFFRDVRVELALPSEVVAVEWLDRDDRVQPLFPDRPLRWGRSTLMRGINDRIMDYRAPSSSDGVLEILENPARLSMSMSLLRSEEDHLTRDDDVVLLMFVDAEASGPLSIDWKLTTGDVHDVLAGQSEIDVSYRDWTEAIASMTEDTPVIGNDES